MLLEILVVMVALVTGYVGPVMVRQLPRGQRSYGWLVCANLALAVVSLITLNSEGHQRLAELLGAVAIGACIVLIFIPPLLRDWARRALVRDRLRIALFLIDLRELIQPDLGARQERELVDAILQVRSGNIEDAVRKMSAARERHEDALARRQVDERIVLTYLYAREWRAAIDHFEEYMRDSRIPLPPQLSVEMVRAHCELGDLAAAADLVQELEGSPFAQEPVVAYMVDRARMVFLAFAGRVHAIEKFLAADGPLRGMPSPARAFWLGIGCMNAGDEPGARVALVSAAKLSRHDRRARELAESTLLSLEQPGVLGPRVLQEYEEQVADRLSLLADRRDDVSHDHDGADDIGSGDAASPTRSSRRDRELPRLTGVSAREVPVTTTLVAINVALVVVAYLLFGSSGDQGALVRMGANVKSAVAVGEYWRLPASVFLHIGAFHLVINMYGLWALGRLLEQMVGGRTYLTVYLGAGVGGAIASYCLGAATLSAGASGAVFGVVGAILGEFIVHKAAYPQRWRKSLFGLLVFLTVANIAIGFVYAHVIDQAAHLGGLLTGGGLGIFLSTNSRWSSRRWFQVVCKAVAVTAIAVYAYGAAGAISSRYGDTLALYTFERAGNKVFSFDAPPVWNQLVFAPAIVPESLQAPEELHRYCETQLQIELSTKIVLPDGLATGWQALAWSYTREELGTETVFTVVAAQRQLEGPATWVVCFGVPQAITKDSTPTINKVLDSLRLNPSPPVSTE